MIKDYKTLDNLNHIHLIGIGGTGLSAIAQVLQESGFVVSGSDRQNSKTIQKLKEMGIKVTIGHSPENILGADLVVRSSAIPDNNPEVMAALEKKIPVLKRREFLSSILDGKEVIAVAGTHGKTTTTSMIAWMLDSLGMDPSYIIGSVSKNLNGSAHAGKGAYFVIEADEYDYMFLGLQPKIAVLMNLEYDHPDCFPTYKEYQDAFTKFSKKVLPEGEMLYNAASAELKGLIESLELKKVEKIPFGVPQVTHDSVRDDTSEFAYSAVNVSLNEFGCYDFYFWKKDVGILTGVSLRIPGYHNVINATAALTVADLIHLPMLEAAKAIGNYLGTERRFDVHQSENGFIVIDDYAHHPTEIKMTLQAAREKFPSKQIWVVWQPHTFSRTRELFREYLQAFDAADYVIITDVFAARESKPKNGFSMEKLALAIQDALSDQVKTVKFIPDLDEVIGYLVKNIKNEDVLLVLSAGDAIYISENVLKKLNNSTSVQEKLSV